MKSSVREMYYGTREWFDYYRCSGCDTLQIVNVLIGDDLARHYPSKYYSYSVASQPKALRWMTMQRDRRELRTGGRPIGTLLAALPPGVRSILGTQDASGDVVRMLGRIGLERDARILDVGCGGGALLDRLAEAGFRSLAGADPFIEASGESPRGVPIMKRYMDDVTGEYDLIMFNHSLEHVPDPVATLKAARERLAVGGTCLVRLPTTTSEAFSVYGEHWCLIDAPRHTVIPSRRGMALAAGKIGLPVENTFDDSNSSQFFGSEAYRRNISLPEIKGLRDIVRIFGLNQMWSWERRATFLNQQGRGDQTGFVLRAM